MIYITVFVTLSLRAASLQLIDAGDPFGKLPLIQEINCATTNPVVTFTDYPNRISQTKTILGNPCRIISNNLDKASYFAYIVGKGKNLQPGKSYLLTVEYPEDQPRSFHIGNWGCETMKGIASGSTVGDILKGKYTNNNSESLKYPLSHKFRTWKQLFFLHNRFPEIKRGRNSSNRTMSPADGFFVIIAQPESKQAPLSAGIAISKIRLFEVPDTEKYKLKTPLPSNLPKRHIFWREEMSDNVISIGHKPEEQTTETRGIDTREDWYEYKCKLMQFLGMNTFCKDLLEFGHNQGWDSTMPQHNASDWYNQTADPDHWNKILTILSKYNFDVLPYYEYAGSIGQNKNIAIGSQRRCRTLNGKKDYTHISWVHSTNADMADPDFLADAKRLLQYTIVRHKDKVNFIGAWLRSRPEANPISFNDKNLARFAKEANDGHIIIRSQLQADKMLLDKYYKWWFAKRKEFLTTLANYLRTEVNPNAFILYTADSSEPGISLPAKMLAPRHTKEPWRWKYLVATDQPAIWNALLNSPRYTQDQRFQFLKIATEKNINNKQLYLKALLAPLDTWGEWEWNHACPQADPQNYKDSDKVLFSYSFNRIYSVTDTNAFKAFRTKNNLAIIRHYPLNENEMRNGKDDILGYFVSDVERAGPFSMASEALAMANGNPSMIGYLVGNNFNRGFPEYARNFNAAFLALPALPGKILQNASSDKEVVVREIKTPDNGTYLAIVNTGWTNKNVTITMPYNGKVINAATGDEIKSDNNTIKLSFYPCQLYAILLQ